MKPLPPEAVEKIVEMMAWALAEKERDLIGTLMWDLLDQQEREGFRELARAAFTSALPTLRLALLQSIREPTERMVKVGEASIVDGAYDNSDLARFTFRAMIDELIRAAGETT